MKLPKLPDSPPPKTLLDKIITATPVVMTVVATILAGLSSSEIGQAQYYRALAAQEQSKASDQWALFQAKRQRGVMAAHDAQLLENLGDANGFSLEALNKVMATTQPSAEIQAAAAALLKPVFAPVQTDFGDPVIAQAYQALARGESETADPKLFAKVNLKSLHEALRKSEQLTLSGEDAADPAARGVEQIAKALHGVTPAGSAKQLSTDFATAQMRFEDAREHHDAKLNQVTAYLYEIAVRKASLDSDRHRTRSMYFFYGMLAAQAGVTIATLALAATVRSTLWVLAATIGLVAVAYAGYVYLFT